MFRIIFLCLFFFSLVLQVPVSIGLAIGMETRKWNSLRFCFRALGL
jgi:hypothetical protein